MSRVAVSERCARVAGYTIASHPLRLARTILVVCGVRVANPRWFDVCTETVAIHLVSIQSGVDTIPAFIPPSVCVVVSSIRMRRSWFNGSSAQTEDCNIETRLAIKPLFFYCDVGNDR